MGWRWRPSLRPINNVWVFSNGDSSSCVNIYTNPMGQPHCIYTMRVMTGFEIMDAQLVGKPKKTLGRNRPIFTRHVAVTNCLASSSFSTTILADLAVFYIQSYCSKYSQPMYAQPSISWLCPIKQASKQYPRTPSKCIRTSVVCPR